MNTLTHLLHTLLALMGAHTTITGLVYMALGAWLVVQSECARTNRLAIEANTAYWAALYARVDAEAKARAGIPTRVWSFDA